MVPAVHETDRLATRRRSLHRHPQADAYVVPARRDVRAFFTTPPRGVLSSCQHRGRIATPAFEGEPALPEHRLDVPRRGWVWTARGWPPWVSCSQGPGGVRAASEAGGRATKWLDAAMPSGLVAGRFRLPRRGRRPRVPGGAGGADSHTWRARRWAPGASRVRRGAKAKRPPLAERSVRR